MYTLLPSVLVILSKKMLCGLSLFIGKTSTPGGETEKVEHSVRVKKKVTKKTIEGILTDFL